MLVNKVFSLSGRLTVGSVVFGNSFVKGPVPRRFLNRQKPRESLFTKEEKLIEYNPVQALHLMRLHSFATFKESVEICVRLNVNPKNGEQVVRGTANLPAGLGKSVRVAVLCSNDEYQDLIKLGAEIDVHLKESTLKEVLLASFSLRKDPSISRSCSLLPRISPSSSPTESCSVLKV